jgi:nitrite reductase/ring-hydroxylating ferredoxin subunit
VLAVVEDRAARLIRPGRVRDALHGVWHGSVYRVADGSVVRGPATAPQPSFQVREVGGVIQVNLPGAG